MGAVLCSVQRVATLNIMHVMPIHKSFDVFLLHRQAVAMHMHACNSISMLLNMSLSLQDDKCLYDYNVQNRVYDFVRASQDISSVTYGDDILIPFGSDFQWISAHQYYKNVDKLIHYINEDGRINAFYSTPAEYVAAKHTYNHSWPLKTDDFFPYADCPVCYWTGGHAVLRVQCCAVLCCAVLCRAGPCRAVPCRAVPCRAVLCPCCARDDDILCSRQN